MIIIKAYYIENMDKPRIIGKKIQIENENIKIWCDIEKKKNIKKIVKKMNKIDVDTVVLDKELVKNKILINTLNANNIKIFDGKWLGKYLTLDILEYIISKNNIEKEKTEIAIAVNDITDFAIEIIRKLAKQYKKLIVVTNHTEKLKKIESEIYEKEGILIVLTNNKNKSLRKAHIILNIDFNREVLNQYKIYENAIILNIEGDMLIDSIRFNGKVINDYEIETRRKEFIWREDFEKFREKDLIEANLYSRDTYEHIRKRIQKSNICIKELYGINGVINF